MHECKVSFKRKIEIAIIIIAKPCFSPELNDEVNGQSLRDFLTVGDCPTKDPTPIIPLTKSQVETQATVEGNDSEYGDWMDDEEDLNKSIAVMSPSQLQVEIQTTVECNDSKYYDWVIDEKDLNKPIFLQVCRIKKHYSKFLFKFPIPEDATDSDSSVKSNADTRAFEQQNVPYYQFND